MSEPSPASGWQAMLFTGVGQPLQAVPVPRPAADQPTLLLEACTICGSDLHTLTGRRPGRTPAILGHEILGRIGPMDGTASTGLTDILGQPLAPGARVVLGVAASCGQCWPCCRGWPQKCQALRKYGHEAYEATRGPRGGLAEIIWLDPGSCLAAVPEELPWQLVTPAGCATATILAACEPWHSSFDQTRPSQLIPESIVVIGLGMLGLTACAWAAHQGVPQIFACDPQPRRRAWAEAFGATWIGPTEALPQALAQARRPSGAPAGVDLVLECSGQTSAAELGLAQLRLGGTLVLVGAVMPGPTLSVAPEGLIRRCLAVRGIHNYAPRHLAWAVQFLAQTRSRFPWTQLIGPAFPLADAQAAMDAAQSGDWIRVAIRPNRVGVS